MANLKEIRTRIDSVQSTEQITTAMRMVSASKLRKAQQAFSAIQPYSDALFGISQDMSDFLKEEKPVHNPKSNNELEQVLLVVFSSNKGLCGPFNMNAVRYVQELVKTTYRQHLEKGKLHIIAVGKKAGEIFEKQKLPVIAHRHNLLNQLHHKDIFELSGYLFDQFQQDAYQKIILIYNKFKTVLTQELTALQFLPILPPPERKEKRQLPPDFIMEPDRESVIQWLYPRMLEITLYRILLESMASEEGARMTAMQQASDNAAALLKELKVSYNKARQAAITNELLEIIAGSEALNKLK
ncbi:MAG: ATP synthase F1 subunit gamma [Bacteroidales bacterium]|nr:ATP synthase F1 subunit gamma [Bacteroidales bacterium]